MQNKFYFAAVVGLFVASAAASVGFGQLQQRTIGSQDKFQNNSPKQLEFEFRIECLRKIEVPAQADGLIREMNVEEGATVPKDAVLFSIDNRVAEAQLKVATRKRESAEKKAGQDAEVRFAESTYEVARHEYEKEFELFDKKATTEAQTRRRWLEAKKAFLQIEVATVTHATDKLALGVAEAEESAAKVQLGLYDIVAPWDAYVNERLKDQGAWIKAGEPVMKIHHMAEMKAVGYINIDDIYKHNLSIQSLEGSRIQVAVNITPTQQHVKETTINFVSSDVDSSNRIRVSARIPNERIGNSWVLRDGLPARVVIFTE